MWSEKKIGIVMALVGVFLFSAKAVVVKVAYTYDVDALTLLLFRMLFALPIYLVITSLQSDANDKKMSYKDVIAIFLLGCVGYYLASYFDFLGLQYIKASLERIILFVYPTMVLIISWIVLRRKITKQQLIATFITYLGIIAAFYQELDFDSDHVVLGGLLIFLSALCYASYLVGSGWLIPKLGVTRFTSYAMIVSCLCVALHYEITSDWNLLNYPIEVYLLGVFMSVMCTVVPSYLVSGAIKRLGASDFAIVASTGPISTIILAFFILDETLTSIQIIGAVVVILGVYWANKK